MSQLSKYSKLIAALVGAVGVAVTEGLVRGAAAHWVAVAVAFLSAAGVYVVPNSGSQTAPTLTVAAVPTTEPAPGPSGGLPAAPA